MLNIPVRRRSPEPTVPPSEPVSGTLHFLQVRIAPLLTGCSPPSCQVTQWGCARSLWTACTIAHVWEHESGSMSPGRMRMAWTVVAFRASSVDVPT